MDPQYGGPQYQGDPMQNGYAGNAYGTAYQQPTKKKKSGVGAVIGIIIALVVIAAAVIFLFSGSIGGAVRSISELEIVSVLFPEMLKVSTSLRPLSPSSYT